MNIKDFARLTRIEHSFILVIAVLAGELVSGAVPSLPVLMLSFITPIFISMSSFAINDYFDVKSDRLNKRFDRPIVSGRVTERQALYTAATSFVIGVSASAFINAYAFVIALIFGSLAMLYSYRLKDMLLWGNIYIALSMAIPFIYGNFVVSATLVNNIVLISFVVFLSGLAREIHGMIRDFEGDKKARNTRNLIRSFGTLRSAYVAFILYIEAVAISLFMFFYERPFAFNLVYIVPIVIVDIVLLYVAAMYTRRYDRKFFWFSRNASLVAMALAIFAYLMSALVFVQA
ncbi:MAG: UbiA family prenyltransferase [Candidatus Marsarchaeota archaeon]|nr:UbiA family prenyltransferase [Candidatus Marsarchaeota archaeon]MCL5418855.1 UbiA family prenyltransferase [Candidatus Marsarchaeota archaeon]